MKFLCDQMLGTLAKWLRFLGYDTTYAGPLPDIDLAVTAREEDRALLTRDKDLAARFPGALLVASDDLEAQLRQVVAAFHLDPDDAMTRCSVCNVPVVAVPREAARSRVPAAVYARQAAFWQCPRCRRLYWEGSHWDRIRGTLAKVRA